MADFQLTTSLGGDYQLLDASGNTVAVTANNAVEGILTSQAAGDFRLMCSDGRVVQCTAGGADAFVLSTVQGANMDAITEAGDVIPLYLTASS
jgi:hypothetical protein